VICPDQLTVAESQLPLTCDPDCARIILNCAVGLLDDTTVPIQVPAMFVPEPTLTSDGAVELPPHAERLAAKQTISKIRIVLSSF
jgi:hypothetical protein